MTDNKYTCPRCGGTGEEREAVPADQVEAPERIWAYIDEDSDGLYIECLSEDPFSPDDAGTEYLLATSAREHADELAEALREIRDEPCMDPDGNAAIAAAVLAKLEAKP